MATNTAGTNARELPFQAVHYLRKKVEYTSENVQVKIGTLPAGAVVIYPMSGVTFTTAFNDSGTDTFDIGTEAAATRLASAAAISAGWVAIDENTANLYFAADTDIYWRYNGENNDATAGVGYVTIAYIPNNDQ